jgi:hypothetical protein
MTQICVFIATHYALLSRVRGEYTQVLGVMTSLLIMSQSKEMFFVLHRKAILVSQQPYTISKVRSYHRAKTFLTEYAILPGLLSDVRKGIFSDRVTVTHL